jgi:ATP-dependent protease ClpP protease subunit
MTRAKSLEPSEVLAQVQTFGVNLVSREIYLHSHYGADEEPGVEYRMATTFVKNLHILEHLSNKQNILIHMHTVGGEWGDGMAIYDAIRACKAPVTIMAHAQASSMSGIILQAAKRRVLMPHCEFLMHYGSVSVDSHSIAAKSVVLWNDSLHQEMLRIFAERAASASYFANDDLNNIERFFDTQMKDKVDWFLSAADALQYGLADGIFGTKGYETIAKVRR